MEASTGPLKAAQTKLTSWIWSSRLLAPRLKGLCLKHRLPHLYISPHSCHPPDMIIGLAMENVLRESFNFAQDKMTLKCTSVKFLLVFLTVNINQHWWCHSLTAQSVIPGSTLLGVRYTAIIYENTRRLLINEGCSFTFHTIPTTHQCLYYNSSGRSMSSAHRESSALINSQTMKVIWFQLITWSLLSIELPTLGNNSHTEKSVNAWGSKCHHIYD